MTVTRCSGYEVEISALFDGESDPATALELLEHVGTCPSCSTFVRKLRVMQGALDRAYDAGQPPSAGVLSIERKRPARRMPRRAWGVAAAIILSLGLSYFFTATSSGGAAGAPEDRQLVIRLEEDRGAMSQDRFIELVSELLRADRTYQNEMYAVLDAVRVGGSQENQDFLGELPESSENENGTRVSAEPTHALN